MTRVLVTGASSFLGAHVLRRLAREGFRVAAFVRDSARAERLVDVLPKLVVLTGDLADLAATRRSVEAFGPDVVVHLAWHGVRGHGRSEPAQILVNVPGTLALVEAAHAAGCNTWIGIGSQEEYGPTAARLREESASSPRSAYGLAKLVAGRLAAALCEMHGMRFLWLRLFATYGPGDDPMRLVPYVILKLLRGERPLLSRGEQSWDYLYVDDVVEAIVALDRAGCDGIFNVASGESRRVADVATRIRDLIDPRLPLGIGERPDDDASRASWFANVTKLRGATGWKPAVDLGEGLRRTIDHFRGAGEAT